MTNIEDFAEIFDRVTNLLMERCEQLQEQINNYTGAGALHGEAYHNAINNYTAQDSELLAPISALLRDSSISDILVNGPDDVFIERSGKLEKTDIKFNNEEILWQLAKQIATRCGRYLDPERPILDARLIDGSRVNIIAPPLALNGTVISIRKFSEKTITLDDMAARGTMSQDMADFLKIMAAVKLNVLITGATGVGKTTLLNAIAQHIEHNHRVVTIEDSAELRLPLKHLIKLEAKPHIHGMADYTEVTIRDLVKNALRMRPDRIIVGETRGAESYDMIQAMNTGHKGSMTTVHANSSRDALVRLENMISTASNNMTVKNVRQQIASAINVVIRIERSRDGERRVTHITEIIGMESDTIITQDLFEFKDAGDDMNGRLKAEFRTAGIMPRMFPQAVKDGFKEKMNQIFKIKF